jgi:release factor glutamine methyltransferase
MGLIVAEVLDSVRYILEEAEIENFSNEACLIIEYATGITKERLITHPDSEISEKQLRIIYEAAKKRATHFPLQYILKKWEFYGLDFKVGKGVLIPRADTEILVDAGLDYLNKHPKKGTTTIVDLFCGSGAVAIAIDKNLDRQRTKIYGIETDPEAAKYLSGNIKYHNSRVMLIEEDAVSVSTALNYSKVDLVTANPPYLTSEDMKNRQEEVTYEPVVALYGGDDGLYFYRKLIPLWKNSLADGGMLACEIGASQARDVKNIFLSCGYKDVNMIKDYGGNPRVITGTK